MSDAEYFLMAWAILSTVLAVFYNAKAKFFYAQHKRTAILLAELAFGDIKATVRPDGFTVVENDELAMTFKRRDD